MKKRATKELILGRGNTEFTYAYVDASNYKTEKTIVMAGWAGDLEDWRQYTTADPDNAGQFFFPAQVGLKPLQGEFFGSGGEHRHSRRGYSRLHGCELYGDDHPYHQLWYVEETAAKPNVEYSAQDLLDRFRQAAETGWDEEAEGKAARLPRECPQTRARIARRTIRELAREHVEEHGLDPADLARLVRQWAYEETARHDIDGLAFFDYIVEPTVVDYNLADFMRQNMAEAVGRRMKLFDGAVIQHPHFGKLVIRVTHRDNVIGHPELWQALGQDGKAACPDAYTEQGLHKTLKWYWRYKPYYSFVNE